MGLRPHLDAKERPIGLFSPNPDNPRFIRDERFDGLKKSLEEFPWLQRVRPVIARPDGRVIGGNMRLQAAKALGWTHIYAVVVGDEIPDEQAEKLVALVDNNQFGEWDETRVGEWLYELRTAGVDLALSGFPKGDVDRILDSVAGPENPAEFPDADPHVDYRCPDCGYGWSGHPRPKNKAGESPDGD